MIFILPVELFVVVAVVVAVPIALFVEYELLPDDRRRS